MKTLEHIFSNDDKESGHLRDTRGNKLIKSPNTGERMIVPQHISEFEFQRDKSKEEMSVSRQTSQNWYMERYYNKERSKKDRTHPAVPDFTIARKEIKRV